MIWQIVFLVVSVLVIGIVAVIYTKKSGSADNKKQFDERQNEIRGKAYRYALSTMVICGLIYFFITMISGKSFAEDGVSVLILILLGGTVFSIYAIFNDSFFGLTEKAGTVSRKSFFVINVIIIMANGYNAVRVITDHELIKNGLLTSKCMYLVFAVFFLIILISLGIKNCLDMKAEQGEE